jgi:hypothetical protein
VFAILVIRQLPSTSTIGGPDRLTSLVPLLLLGTALFLFGLRRWAALARI